MPPPSRPDPRLVTADLLRGWPLPATDGGKEARGRALIIGGSRQTPGAVLLAAEAALRCGAGKLQVAVPAGVAPQIAVALPEALVQALPETRSGGLDPSGVIRIADLLADASAVLVGPGLTDVRACALFVEAARAHVRSPLVLDALALARLTGDLGCLADAAHGVVLTPNPRELAETLEVAPEGVSADPAEAVWRLAQASKAAVALGGAASWVASADGRLWCDHSGHAGLGISGSGDVRAGILVGLLARGADVAQAAVWSTFVHGRVGERLAASIGRLGFLARELPAEVPHVLAEIEL